MFLQWPWKQFTYQGLEHTYLLEELEVQMGLKQSVYKDKAKQNNENRTIQNIRGYAHIMSKIGNLSLHWSQDVI